MSSYLSSLLTTTTSRYNSLRRTLLSDETDGDTEDDTHISRVLRAYYTEKGRPFPPWLPPDPRAPQRPAVTPFVTTSTAGRSQPLHTGGRGNGLSDLWDSPQKGAGSQEQQQQHPLSLRRGGQARPGGFDGAGSGSRHGSEGGIVDSYGGTGGGRMGPPYPDSRPLPAQRSGSAQSMPTRRTGSIEGSGGGYVSPSPPPTASSATSAHERLKARLLGRSASPTQVGGGGGGPTQPPPPPLQQQQPPPGTSESQGPARYAAFERRDRYGSAGSSSSSSLPAGGSYRPLPDDGLPARPYDQRRPSAGPTWSSSTATNAEHPPYNPYSRGGAAGGTGGEFYQAGGNARTGGGYAPPEGQQTGGGGGYNASGGGGGGGSGRSAGYYSRYGS